MDVKCRAEIKKITCRAEIHGDQFKPAVDVTLMLMLVPVSGITSLCPDLTTLAYNGAGQVTIGEVNPLTVQHKLENLRVNLGHLVIRGADIKKGAKIHLQPNQLANVEVKVQCQETGTLASDLLSMLRDEVHAEISERQLSVVGMEQ